MRIFIKSIIVIVILVICVRSNAQDSVKYYLSKIHSSYKASPYLSFSVKYEYSTETNPAMILDSAHGRYKLNGVNLWSSIDSTETYANEKLLVVAYHREKKLFVDRPEKLDPISSIANLDSLLTAKEIHSIRILEGKEILVQFKHGLLYRSAIISFHPTTFFVNKISYLLNPTTEEETSNSLVQIYFSNYDVSPFDNDAINPNLYIEKQKNAFAGIGRYKEYEVFVGSSKLLN